MTVTEPIATAVVRALAEHRLLTTQQLLTLAAPGRSRQRLQQVLKMLTGLGLVERVRAYSDGSAAASNQWYLTDDGRREARRLPELKGDRIAVVTEASARAQTHRHTLAVNTLGIALARAGAARGDTVTWQHERHVEISHRRSTPAEPNSLTADAAVCIEANVPGGIQTLPYLVELDRGTQPLSTVVDKVRHYMTYRRYVPKWSKNEAPAWRSAFRYEPDRPYQGFPTLLFAFAGRDPALAERRLTEFARLLQNPQDSAVAAAADPETGVWVMLTLLHTVAPTPPTETSDAYGLHYYNPHGDEWTDPFGGTVVRPTLRADRTPQTVANG